MRPLPRPPGHDHVLVERPGGALVGPTPDLDAVVLDDEVDDIALASAGHRDNRLAHLGAMSRHGPRGNDARRTGHREPHQMHGTPGATVDRRRVVGDDDAYVDVGAPRAPPDVSTSRLTTARPETRAVIRCRSDSAAADGDDTATRTPTCTGGATRRLNCGSTTAATAMP